MPTNAMAAAKIVEIKPGDAVPFSGNLVPPITFQAMMVDVRERSVLEEELEYCKEQRDKQLEGNSDGPILLVSSIIGSFVLGSIFGRYVRFP